ncbi:MAG: type II toxin-antitoxin system VapC family toxin [Candidatus Poribacteria bacterium]|nr:type II toxin-antitoxin system VapC family toxin [Candidatus Poribacteria bacterium]
MQQETKKRIYIDTSIPSSYYTLRTDEDALAKQRRTQNWWNEYANQFSLTSSVAVIGELTRGRSEATQMRRALIESIELLPITDRILQIGRIYTDRLIMPQDPHGDALHVAIASFHNVDAILTWNLAHIANPNKIHLIQRINQELGLSTPDLTTPLDYLGGTD